MKDVGTPTVRLTVSAPTHGGDGGRRNGVTQRTLKLETNKNKLDKPYKHLQSQGQGHTKNGLPL